MTAGLHTAPEGPLAVSVALMPFRAASQGVAGYSAEDIDAWRRLVRLAAEPGNTGS